MNIAARKPHYCLQCDDGTELELDVRDVTLHADDVTRIVPEIAGWHCPECGEIEFVDQDSARRMSAAWGEAWAEARGGTLLDIRAIRKKLGLKQAEAGRIFGGGASAFSEYERGKKQPHKSTLKLLHLLDLHPDLLAEIS